MEQTIIIGLVIAVFAIVQSVFGMGLLVFGTPTLLLLGLPFADTLGWLLPASVAISAIQVLRDHKRAKAEWTQLRPLFCVVPLVAALAFVLAFGLHAKFDWIIGFTMVMAATIRLNTSLQQRLTTIILQAERLYLVLMGLLHGFTNMGGALLSVYASTMHWEKHEIRATISSYYLTFGSFQIAIIALLKPEVLGWQSLAAATIAAILYWLIGRLMFSHTSSRIYYHAITGFMTAYGVAILVKASIY